MRKHLIFFAVMALSLVAVFSARAETRPPAPPGTSKTVVEKIPQAGQVINYSWAGKKMDTAFWGMAAGDIDGNGGGDIMLLSRRGAHIGRLDDQGFKETAVCGLPGLGAGARVYLFDLDGDGSEEIVVSAVEEGMPAASAIRYKGGKCEVIFERARWWVRVIDGDGTGKLLIGQGWSSDSLFSGPIYRLNFEKGALKKGAKIDVPRYVNVFQFARLAAVEDAARVAAVKGNKPLEVYEKVRKSFKRIWRTGERFGGSANQLPASQREVLGEEDADVVVFDVPPIVYGGGKMLALRHEMPLRGVIGKKPLIHGAEIVAFRPDQVIVFEEEWKTVRLPGSIADMVMVPGSAGAGRLLALMQDEPGMFLDSERSTVIGFDLP